MSYPKNTIMFSDVTPIVRDLIAKKENYHLGTLGYVQAEGRNDDTYMIDSYALRILIYKGGILLEQLRRTSDDELDDFIVSEQFNFDEMPDIWLLETYVDVQANVIPEDEMNVVELYPFKKHVEEFVKGGK